jgi:protein-L-isoaspartate(D-aspartate) O-methyltransferase
MNTQDINKRIRLIMKLRTMGIGDTNVLGAIEKVPREYFVPEAVIDQAWDDIALPIGRGQTISQPFVVASMTAALELGDRDTVLEIGTGCGYQTAILCRLVRRVYTIERHKPLLDDAVVRFEQLKIRNVTAIAADGMQGWPTMRGAEAAQFDKIIVTAAARDKPPQALLDQLKVGGILIIPVGESGAQVLRRYKKESDDTYAMRDLMDVRFVPLLPDLAGNVEAVA